MDQHANHGAQFDGDRDHAARQVRHQDPAACRGLVECVHGRARRLLELARQGQAEKSIEAATGQVGAQPLFGHAGGQRAQRGKQARAGQRRDVAAHKEQHAP